MRRRRRAKRNPVPSTTVVLAAGALAGVGASAVGLPQVGGAILLGTGTYSLVKGDMAQKLIGGVFDILGLGMLTVRGR
jgi:hypothetical protein